ncbi:hypothetical protein [Methylobacterium sp. Leaf112]|uniref:hypothetical protein n=1 Tax=Methylobacterium sp. Leaf112 TaxID=1736258 RepID=UPI0012E881E2|nr:hypothetical protein [Methylobacterium sp. Leaf112]
MALSITGGTFKDVGTIYKGPDNIDVSIVDAQMERVGTVFEIVNRQTQMMTGVPAPVGATREEVLELIEASKLALQENRDPVAGISQTKTWARWAGLGADLITVATPIVQFAWSLMPK